MSCKQKIARAFNRSIKHYDEASSAQFFSGETLIQQLKPYQSEMPETVLELGCGTGRITKKLIDTLFFKEYVALDIAEDLLNQAKNRLNNERIHFIKGDFDKLTSAFDNQFSLIFSNMALHWSDDFETLLDQLHQALKTDGIIAFTMPLVGTLKELRQESIRAFYQLSDVISSLHKHHFTILHSTEHQHVMAFNNIMQALMSLRNTGVTHLNKKRKSSLSGKKDLESLYQVNNNEATLTYQVGVLIAKKS